ncbi:MAG: M20/M25/M40 family metallo-hydrolase [Archangium sp.]|nr:M20/M25/M40 family metallo-hydrolase [Archangium sp.]
MSRTLALVTCVLFGCPGAQVRSKPVVAPPDEVSRLQGLESQAFLLATSLCDVAGQRFSGSAGSALAVTWGVETMKRLGLENVHTEPVMVPKWTRLSEEARIVSPLAQPLAITALGHSVSTPEGGLEAEVVEVESLEALTALKPDSLKGKWLFANVAMRRTVDGAGYGAVASVRHLAGVQALAAGAVGALIRSVGTDTNRLGHTGSQGADFAKLPAAALAVPDADLLHRLLRGGPVKVNVKLITKEEAPVESANVVGEVLGRERPDEVVLLGAHLDSWDLGTGALDDGAGVGIVLDVARALQTLPQRPRRTVRVVLFANEENGLGGAKAYGLAHQGELGKHVLAMEADSGSDRARAVRLLSADGARAAFLSWGPWLTPLGVVVEPDDAGGGADTSVLRAAGVPQLDVRQDASRYFDFHHTANDTVDKLDEPQLTQAARAFSTMTWLVAEQPVDFGRVPEDKRARKR